jgi:DNA primase
VDIRQDSQQAKEEIKQRLDLVALVSEAVVLKRSGASLKGLCPFHDEKTASFHVYPSSQHFKCYGCQKGGDVFTWVMERERLGFLEALRMLADRTGVQLPEASGAEVRAARVDRDLFGILERVQAWFHRCLAGETGRSARDYVEGRGLTAATESFGIGYAPGPVEKDASTHWPLADKFRRSQLPVEAGIQAGVLGRSRAGHIYDKFRNRVTFPIQDDRGRVVGFGGRILPGFESETEPKYVNSPESPVFNKRRVLFALDHARTQRAREVVVMEGYTDVIAAHIAGVSGAVATLGTSLTNEHAVLLRRFAPDGATLLFDGDRAGRLAAERAYRALAGEILPTRIALLAPGMDPADLVADEGRAGLDRVLEAAEDSHRAFLRLLGQRLDLSTAEGRAQAYQECCEVLATIRDRFRRQDLLERMAAGLMITPEVLEAGIGRPPRREAAPEPQAQEPERAGPVSRMRDHMVAALLRSPEVLTELIERWPGEEEIFAPGYHRTLVADLQELVLRNGAWPEPAELLSRWLTLMGDDPAGTHFVLRLDEIGRTIEEPLRAVLDGVKFLGQQLDLGRVARLKESYRQALADSLVDRARELEAELTQTLKRLGRPPSRRIR